ncbi:glycosyltransferase [Pedobacter sp. KR3-3]|uniref:Glycosyltransferase n=1 Tax=Pedobacter albus TaxID=3113905 RepID=A0ABU7IBV6_9SPHI|nr:glycosyltransferase [Pedobacter sp. KR3-3]MEE1946851.1 glycosyltransferase [Pedobacter sp. KR3-3]
MSKYLMINDLGNGGAEILNIGLYRELKFDTILILQGKIDYKTDDLNVIDLSNGKKYKWYRLPVILYRLTKIIKKDDLVVASLYKSMLVVALFGFFVRKIKTIFWIHSDTKIYLSSKLRFFLLKKVLSVASRVVVNSKKAQSELIGTFNMNDQIVKVIYNCFDIEDIKKSKLAFIDQELLENLKHFPKIACIGRFNILKGQSNLIRLLAGLKQRGIIMHLILIGSGELEMDLRDEARNFGISDFVHFLGQKQNVYPYLNLCDILICPSKSEGFGNVLVEALACGVPVVSADIDNGPREILSPNSPLGYRTSVAEYAEYGILMPSFYTANKEQVLEIWSNTLIKLFSDNELKRYKDVGLAYVNKFDKHTVLPIWKDLIEDLQK